MKPVIDFKVSGTHFYFNVKDTFTKLSDNSGVGKSFLCDALQISFGERVKMLFDIPEIRKIDLYN